jgi:hypothetical protein
MLNCKAKKAKALETLQGKDVNHFNWLAAIEHKSEIQFRITFDGSREHYKVC